MLEDALYSNLFWTSLGLLAGGLLARQAEKMARAQAEAAEESEERIRGEIAKFAQRFNNIGVNNDPENQQEIQNLEREFLEWASAFTKKPHR